MTNTRTLLTKRISDLIHTNTRSSRWLPCQIYLYSFSHGVPESKIGRKEFAKIDPSNNELIDALPDEQFTTYVEMVISQYYKQM